MEALKKENVGVWTPSKRMVWKCRAHPLSKKHQYKLFLAERVERLAWAGGNGCPRCSFYGEECVAAWLRSQGVEYVREATHPTWDATGWRYDFMLDAQKVMIEVDGDQHFKKVNRTWTGPAAQQARDRQKTARAVVHGYHCIRIRQWDVVHSDWKESLAEVVRGLQGATEPEVHVIATDPECYAWLTGKSTTGP